MNLTWKPIAEPPENSGYVLVAATNFGELVVLRGYCLIHQLNGRAIFRADVYSDPGIQITHWMPLPTHPMEKWQEEIFSEANIKNIKIS
jgi:hypothetical protein